MTKYNEDKLCERCKARLSEPTNVKRNENSIKVAHWLHGDTSKSRTYEEYYIIITEGVDFKWRSTKGYTLNELAGFAGRYDIVDLLNRVQYMPEEFW